MSKAGGLCDPKFYGLKKLLEDNVASGEELGASLYVDVGGKLVVDMYAGFMDEAKTQPWAEDTKTAVFSTSKCITNLAALVLVDRGLLNLDAKVSKYWPEFATKGKEDIEIRHILSHSSGLSGWDEPMTMEKIYDLEGSANLLADQAPWWKPGSASGYHAITQGTLIGKLVEEITGKSLKAFIKEELAQPLDADYSLGVEESDWPRVAPVVPLPSLPFAPNPEPDSVLSKTLKSLPLKAEFFNEPPLRRAALGASNGYGNARSVGKIMSIISLGGNVSGKEFLSQKTLDRVFQEEVDSIDLVEGRRYKWGPGFALPIENDSKIPIPQGNVCFWGGWGGSIAVMDADRKATICYVMNKMGDESGCLGTDRTRAYVREIYRVMQD
ncbi:beta-lactamase [Penicillium canescens]|nr:beta-lactamase [Penicillium canescens]